jgi:predicted RND superfamily exporter protein/(2Fe-2S) ferredoxin
MVVRPKPLSESGQRLALKVAVASAINEFGLRPYFAGDAGPVAVDVAELTSILRDTVWLVPLTAMTGLLLLAWVVGRWRPVAIGAVAMSTVVLPTIAGIVAFGQPYTMATAILPSLLAAYTIATLLHLYAGFQNSQRESESRADCIDRALTDTRKPSVFNVLTTGAGLLSLLLVPIPPIQVFGLAGAAGTAMVFLTVHFLVPPFLRHWDNRPWPQQASGLGRLGKLARRTALRSMRYPKTVVVSLVVLMASLAPFLREVRVETDLLAFFAPTHPVNTGTSRIEAALGGVTSLEISLKGTEPDTFQRVATLREIKRLQTWLESQPEIDRTVSMVDLVEEMHWGMNRERPEFRVLPGSDRLLRQYLLVYDGNDLYELVNRDFDHARIVLNLKAHGTQAIGHTIDRIRSRVEAEPIPGTVVKVGGYGRLLVDQIGLLVDGQIASFAGSFLQIFLLMAFLWRSLSAAAICMVPNLAPLYFFFVLMGATGIPLDMATVMIASVVLGITVDDTIHLFHGYRKRLQLGLSPVFALARSYETTGRAVLATSAVLIAQFGLLTTSDFIPTSNFGLITSVGLLSGLLFEFLLPALLVLTSRSNRPNSRSLGAPTGAAIASNVVPGITSRTGIEAAAEKQLLPMGAPGRRRVLVCHGDACKDAGGFEVWRRLDNEQRRLSRHADVEALRVTKTSCLGPCRIAPVIQVFPEGSIYGLLNQDSVGRIVEQHLVQGREVTELALSNYASRRS